MRTLLLAATLVICSPLAAAKCGAKTFTLSGTVVMPDGKPAADARVGAAWKEDNLIGGPALAKSDATGHYSLPIAFRTYSSSPGKSWYECNGKLEQVTVSAYSGTFYAPPAPVPVPENSSHIEAAPLELSFDILTGVPTGVGG